MVTMNLATLDLEGVLIPEIWIGLAERTGIDELRRTTRDEPDYDKLMRYRLDLLAKHGLGLPDVAAVVDAMEPLPGAVEFIRWLRARTRVVILSDTFEEFALPLMAKLDYPTLFCHRLVIGPSGSIDDYQLRQPDQKRRAVQGFQAMGFQVVAAGDSFNDLTMLEAADAAIYFRPAAGLPEKHPDYPVADDHIALRQLFFTAMGLGG
jgi:phosphoserine / homoserine phosphotransferase